MNKHIFSVTVCGFLLLSAAANAVESTVPEPFQGFDDNSKLTIDYTDLDSLLQTVVLSTGRSSREKASPSHAKTGTRMQVKVNRATINEGNRFYFEVFDGNEGNLQTLANIRGRLESIPDVVPLEKFSRAEQLAYWINLYNIKIVEEIAQVYPERVLEDLLVGKKSVLSRRSLNVAGVPLSLDDIQFTILRQNYNNNPLVIYGLYQGIIGGPNIRKNAYTGKYVYGDLIDNAIEFINSNRGTEIKNNSTFRVSSLYERNQAFFTDFEADLTRHLLSYLEGEEHDALQAATRIKSDIDDWTITDLYGSYREVGGSLASNNAALLGAASGGNSSRYAGSSGTAGAYSPAVLKHLEEINQKKAGDDGKTGVVTIEEMGQAPQETGHVDKENTEND